MSYKRSRGKFVLNVPMLDDHTQLRLPHPMILIYISHLPTQHIKHFRVTTLPVLSTVGVPINTIQAIFIVIQLSVIRTQPDQPLKPNSRSSMGGGGGALLHCCNSVTLPTRNNKIRQVQNTCGCLKRSSHKATILEYRLPEGTAAPHTGQPFLTKFSLVFSATSRLPFQIIPSSTENTQVTVLEFTFGGVI